MNKIIVATNPVGPFQKVFAVSEDGVLAQIGVGIEDLPETIHAFATKYSICDVEFTGAREYALGLMRDAQNNTQFSTGLKFKYYGG